MLSHTVVDVDVVVTVVVEEVVNVPRVAAVVKKLVVTDVDVVEDRSVHTSQETSTASVKIKHSEQSRHAA